MKESFNDDFCLRLEYHLCETLWKSTRGDIRGFWCDGVGFWDSDPQITKKRVNGTRRIETVAYLGKSGQEPYKMTIRLGRYALRRYARGNSMVDCIPSNETMDWIDVDTVKRTIEIRLR